MFGLDKTMITINRKDIYFSQKLSTHNIKLSSLNRRSFNPNDPLQMDDRKDKKKFNDFSKRPNKGSGFGMSGDTSPRKILSSKKKKEQMLKVKNYIFELFFLILFILNILNFYSLSVELVVQSVTCEPTKYALSTKVVELLVDPQQRHL